MENNNNSTNLFELLANIEILEELIQDKLSKEENK